MEPTPIPMILSLTSRHADNLRGCGKISGFIGPRPLWLAGGLGLAALAIALLFTGPGHVLAQSDPSTDSTWSEDYDADDDRLIDIRGLYDLHVIRWDPDGDGVPSGSQDEIDGYHDLYNNAAPGMGCPEPGCIGYEMLNDLDFDTKEDGEFTSDDAFWNDGAGWEPLTSGGYTAVFEGNGYTISNLRIDRAEYNIGLFRLLGPDGVIRNVSLIDADVVSDSTDSNGAVGALAGKSSGASPPATLPAPWRARTKSAGWWEATTAASPPAIADVEANGFAGS